LTSLAVTAVSRHGFDVAADFIQNASLATGEDMSLNECIFSPLGGNTDLDLSITACLSPGTKHIFIASWQYHQPS